MPSQLGFYLLAFSLMLGSTAKAMAQEPTFTAIKPPDGDGTITYVFDINNRGEMVGAYNSAPDGHRYGFLRSKDGEFTRINYPGSFRTHADAINSRGEIVGWYARVPGEIHGYLRKKTGEFVRIDLERLGATDTRVTGINSRGDIVGFYCVNVPAPQCGLAANNRTHGFLLSEGKFTTIDFPNALGTQAYKINSHGEILGRYRDTSPEKRSHLFLLSKGEFTTIDVPGAFETGVGGTNAGLNECGDIVGDYCDAAPCTSNGTVHGFLLSEGEFITIDVPGAVGTSAYGINTRGDIVGPFDSDASHTVGFLRSGENRDDDNEKENERE